MRDDDCSPSPCCCPGGVRVGVDFAKSEKIYIFHKIEMLKRDSTVSILKI